MRTAALLLLSVVAAAPAQAQRLQTAVLPEAITVGDVFHAAIRVELAADATLVPPDSIALPPDLELAGRRELRVDSAGGTRRVTVIYPLSAWRPGSYTVEPVTLRLLQGGAEATLLAELPAFSVRSVLPADTAGIEPQPASDVLGANRLWWPILAGLLLAAIVAGLLYAWWRRRRAAVVTPAAAFVPATPPREAALTRLAELRRSGLLERGEVKAYYEILTEALRRYVATLHPRWGVDLTTSELSAELGGAALPGAFELGRILGAADLVKFARARPPAEVAVNDLDAAYAWIERVPAAEAAADERMVA
jgi:hypothetical protein